jgi:hypothetical protein
MKPGKPDDGIEGKHFGNCPICGEVVDMRDLAQVLEHTHGLSIEIDDDPPLGGFVVEDHGPGLIKH